jgi:hypothetical protein
VRREKGEEQMNPHLQEILHNITTRLAALEQSQKKEWHGLTDEERLRCFDDVDWNKVDWCPDHEQYAKAIEAKLKEKNT